MVETFENMGITFVIQLKSSRRPKTNPSPRNPKKFLVDIFSAVKRVSCRTTTRENKLPSKLGLHGVKFVAGSDFWISGSGKDAKQIRVRVAAVYNHIKERNAFGYYATNDLLCFLYLVLENKSIPVEYRSLLSRFETEYALGEMAS
jgi:hypothetical protein